MWEITEQASSKDARGQKGHRDPGRIVQLIETSLSSPSLSYSLSASRPPLLRCVRVRWRRWSRPSRFLASAQSGKGHHRAQGIVHYRADITQLRYTLTFLFLRVVLWMLFITLEIWERESDFWYLVFSTSRFSFFKNEGVLCDNLSDHILYIHTCNTHAINMYYYMNCCWNNS